MPSKNIECQLAQGQIGRYLSGDRFSSEAVRQLEAHIADCPECSEMLAARKAAVMAKLGEKVPTRAAVHMDTARRVDTAIPASPSTAAMAAVNLLRALNERSEEDERPVAATTTRQLFPKPVLYCGGLALVLLAMSYFSRGALSSLGPTANQAIASAPAPAKSPAPTPAPQVAPVAGPTHPPVTHAAAPSVPTPASATAAQVVTHPVSKPVPTDTPVAAPKTVPTDSPIAAPKAAARPTPKLRSKAVTHHRRMARRTPHARVRISVHRLTRHERTHIRRPARRSHPLRTPRVRMGVRMYDPQGRPLN